MCEISLYTSQLISTQELVCMIVYSQGFSLLEILVLPCKVSKLNIKLLHAGTRMYSTTRNSLQIFS
jgi:hypothetical protein